MKLLMHQNETALLIEGTQTHQLCLDCTHHWKIASYTYLAWKIHWWKIINIWHLLILAKYKFSDFRLWNIKYTYAANAFIHKSPIHGKNMRKRRNVWMSEWNSHTCWLWHVTRPSPANEHASLFLHYDILTHS